MNCPNCRAPTAEGSAFCMKCGMSLRARSSYAAEMPDSGGFCGACGSEVRSGDAVCPSCGARIGASVESAKPRGRLQRFVLFGGTVLLLLFVILGGFAVYRAWRQSQDLAAHYALGSAALQTGDYQTALQELGWVVQRSPDYQDAQAQLESAQAGADSATLSSQAQAYCDQQEWDQAISVLERLQASAPDYQADAVRGLLSTAYRNLGLDLVQRDQFAQAVQRFDQSLALTPDVEVEKQKQLAILYPQGLAALDQGQYASAIQVLSEVYAVDPKYRDVVGKLHAAYLADCTALRDSGNLEGAETRCVAAYQLDPTGSEAAVQLTQVAFLRTPATTPTLTGTPTPTATGTGTPSPTSTSTSIATPTPAATPLPPPLPSRSLDDFEGYGSDVDLQMAYPLNCAWSANDGGLSLANPPNVGSGSHAAAFTYDIRSGAPNDYCGFERRFNVQDWRRYSILHFWAKSDRSARQLVVQFGESSGEVWKFRTQLSGFGTKEFSLALNQQIFSELAVYPELGDPNATKYKNGRMDLQAVTYFAFFVGHGSLGPGQIYIDSVELR